MSIATIFIFIGLVVLKKLNIDVGAYYASEISPEALMVSEVRHGDNIIYLGNVRAITEETLKAIEPINILIGGSPCEELSMVNPKRKGLHGKKYFYN